MKANDLRIGNWVQYDGIPYQIESLTKVDAVVCSIDIFDFRNRSLEQAQPIELTEDVLLKIGFEKVYTVPHNRLRLCVKNGNEITRISYDFLFDDITRLEIMGNGDSLNKRNIKYLHELQNSYYCLTNQELEIKL